MGKPASCLGKGCSTLFALASLWVACGIVVSAYKSCESDEERAERFEKNLKKELAGRDDVIVEDGKIILIDEVRKKKETQTTPAPQKQPSFHQMVDAKPGDPRQPSFHELLDKKQQVIPQASTPTGRFTIDFSTKSGPNKQYQFAVYPRDKSGKISLRGKELGEKESLLGGTARFNVIFWNAGHPEKKGLTFQLCLSETQGVSVRGYDPSLATIYLSDNERVCGRLNPNNTISFKHKTINLKGARSLRTINCEVPDKFFEISPHIQSGHSKSGRPMIIFDRATRAKMSQKERS